MPRHLSGICFAVCAAALNATIGALSKLLISAGLTTSAIAFYKTAVAVIVVSFVLLLLKHAPHWRGCRAQWWQAAVCSMLGIFMLFFFETRAYQHTDAATAVVVLMASAALSAIVLGRFFLGDRIDRNILLGAVLAIIGMAVIFQKNLATELNILGVWYAGLAGLGYGAFSVCMKKMKAKGGLLFTRQLLVFGALYLAIPAIHEQALSITLSVDSAIILLLLAIFPTLLGFFCTTKAIELLKPSQVQTIELSEPLFAGVFAFIVMGEVPGMSTLYGGVLIVLGLLFSNHVIPLSRKQRTLPCQ